MKPTPIRLALLLGALALTAPEGLAQRGAVDVRRVRRLEPPLETPLAPPAAMLRRTDLLSGQRPAIMLTGYWPPTNEMIRHFSDDPLQNPNGWLGLDWEGRGYDVYAYFPEFAPGCIFCGKGAGDLEVDYQDTSNDFWRLADDLQPLAIITFSRGANDSSWEVEVNQFNKDGWIPDYAAPTSPTPNPPDVEEAVDFLRPSNLPLQAIVDAVDALMFNIVPFICFTGDGGGFLSEFVAYHGVWYRDLHSDPADPAWCAAAGHVHVGGKIAESRARLAAEATLRTVIATLDQIVPPVTCQSTLGFGGPGNSSLSVCGDPLQSGGSVDLLLTDAPANATTFLLVGLQFMPTSFMGGRLVPVPILNQMTFATDHEGQLLISDIPGGGGPFTAYLQAVVMDAAQPAGFGLSNALQLDYLP